MACNPIQEMEIQTNDWLDLDLDGSGKRMFMEGVSNQGMVKIYGVMSETLGDV